MKQLWKLEWDADGEIIGGLFIATYKEMKSLIGLKITFGENAGGLSELSMEAREENITLVSDDLIVIESIEKYGGNILKFPSKD